ncbi:MAG: bifunctional glutamate N-acetyltransferase/amino-acid acetyltransferase ArgJ [Candidatus Omnitrophica bacterium]|nr:bifunctional glutamate N-acetyltransferase/amino-acid acetyltransferase ArgJ [Candidatus Omnitrophota bacterium]
MDKYRLPKGFLASGIHCGLKKKRKDLALLFSKSPCKAEAVFTTNAVKAAPVVLAMKQLEKKTSLRAVFVNSGNANCMTGKRGLSDAREMSSRMSRILGTEPGSVLVSSTGIIGEPLDMKPILRGAGRLAENLSAGGLKDAAEGMITTDNFIKVSVRKFSAGGKEITVTGVAKGAGMIHPDMATTLCFILTDAVISRTALRKALKESAEESFNSITVDGDMSTNDTMLVLANGEASNRSIQTGSKEFSAFSGAMKAVSTDLAKMIVRDGEGANKMIEVTVKGARSRADARAAAKGIASSLLVKCAVLGGDPNWGRVASSAGASGARFDPDKITIKLDGTTFYRKGKAVVRTDRKKSRVFKGKKAGIEVSLGNGRGEARVYSCDISKKYITLNSYYTT